MSFTSIVKNEVSKAETNENENIAELSAIIRSGAIIDNTLKIVTENASVARRIFNLFKELYLISPDITVRKSLGQQKKHLYILEVTNEIDKILNSLSIYEDKKYLNIPKEYFLDDDESIRAYLRGIFLMSGSINDPKTSRYHLEFGVDTKKYAQFISNLLNTYYLNSKILKRENKYMIYVKEAEKIGDFLRIIQASNAILYFEDIRIYRDHKNMTNRLNNCEQANIDRMIETANDQVNDIILIQNNGGLEILDEKEQIVATYRLKYRDVSLSELSYIIGYETGEQITKSGLYHRFKKIKVVANRIRAKN